MVVVTFMYPAVILCFIQIYLVFVLVTWLEGRNNYMGLLMIKPITWDSLNLSTVYVFIEIKCKNVQEYFRVIW
jgi:hypothetical protein